MAVGVGPDGGRGGRDTRKAEKSSGGYLQLFKCG
jgi:hypothetical protein